MIYTKSGSLRWEMYLQICADYIDIFLSPRLDLRSRLALAAKVSFFLQLSKLWLTHEDHSVLGNTRSITVAECFITQQCFVDIQMSCHFVVLLAIHFRNKYPHLAVPFQLTGSDSCEIFFSKVGAWWGLNMLMISTSS
jgi:hypothetical protein